MKIFVDADASALIHCLQMKTNHHSSRLQGPATSGVNRVSFQKVLRLGVAILLAGTASVVAQTNTWNATTTQNWSNTGNWTLGHVPTSSETITNSSDDRTTTINTNAEALGASLDRRWNLVFGGSNRTFAIGSGGITVNNSGVLSSFRVLGSTSGLNGTVTLNGDITNNNSSYDGYSAVVFGASGYLDDAQKYTPVNLTFNGNINLNAGSEIVFNVANSSVNLGLITLSGSGTRYRTIDLNANGYTGSNKTFNTTGINDSSLTAPARIAGTVAYGLGSNAYYQYNPSTGYSTSWTAPISNTTLAINNSVDYSTTALLQDGLRGTLGLTKTGSGIQTLSGNNTFTGSTSISGGAIKVGHDNALGFGGVSAKGVAAAVTTVNSGGTLDLGGYTVQEKITLNGGTLRSTANGSTVGSGIAALDVSASGSDFTTSNRTLVFTGGGGTSAVGNAQLGMTTASLNITSGTGAGWVVGDTIVVRGGGAQREAVFVVTSVSGGAITGYQIADSGYGYTGTPANAVSASNGISIPGGRTAPTFAFTTGNYMVAGIQITSAGSGYTSAPTVSVAGKSITATATLSGTELAADSSVGGTHSLNFASAISGAGQLTKIDSNTVTLSAENSFSGGTLVNAGTLVVASTGNLGTGNVTVGSGATLTLQGNTSMLDSTDLILSLSTTVVNLDFVGLETIHYLTMGGVYQSIGTWGAVGSGATYENALFAGTGLLNVTAIPEPQTWVLFALGIALVLHKARRLGRLG